jgi:predicted nucleic acid-binding protein
MKRLRVYVDTSVFGGCLEAKFAEPSQKLMEDAKAGRVLLLVSTITRAELKLAPEQIQRVLDDLPVGAFEDLTVPAEALDLADAYINAKVIGAGMLSDAQHIATATVHRADVLVSWNFKHIVNLARVHGYNSVNMREGYPLLEIRTPNEVDPHVDDRADG